jgi:hypothetical protein
VKTHGLPAAMADNLTGTVDFSVVDGKLMETGMVKGLSDALSKVSKSLAFRELSFSDFKSNLAVEKGKLLVKDSRVNSGVIGEMLSQGAIGFDNTLALNLETHLPPGLSNAVAGAGGALASELAKVSKVPALGNVSLVPKDAKGRAVLYFLVGGLLTNPSFSLDTKRMAAEGAGGAKSVLGDAVKKKKEELQSQVNAKKDSLEKVAQARADEEKKKLEQKIEEEKKKKEEEAKKQGKKVLKGLGL